MGEVCHSGHRQLISASVEIVELRSQWDGPETTGQLLSTHLMVHGVLEPARVLGAQDGLTRLELSLDHIGYRHHWTPDTEDDRLLMMQDSASVVCLRVCTSQPDRFQRITIDVLVLRQLSDHTSAALNSRTRPLPVQSYERVGIHRIALPTASSLFTRPSETIRLV
jgi:hypothetical protein